MKALFSLALAMSSLGCAELPYANDASQANGLAEQDPEYTGVVRRVSKMVDDADIRESVIRRDLALVNVTWEDTGRAMGSSLGPNISDFTLQVRHRVARAAVGEMPEWMLDPDNVEPPVRWEETLMPVIRHPNFVDKTGDIPADRFFVRTGNQRGGGLASVSLASVIADIGRFATSPSTLGPPSREAGGRSIDLSAPRDTHYLVSAQALFLPIPKRGKAEFNPVLFNYQSAPGSPAVLAILTTREGTSMTVIENRREDEGAHWGQELYFNEKGQRACFTAERRSDVSKRIAAHGGPKNEAERSMLARGADVMAMIQIPLKHQNLGLLGGLMSGISSGESGYGYEFSDDPLAPGGFGPNDATVRVRPGPVKTDLERAVLGHGPTLGPFLEGHGTKLVRDPAFPIRITIQFYKATASGVVSEDDLDAIATSIESVYAHADYVGSLVLPEDDTKRPTAWQHVPGEWFPW